MVIMNHIVLLIASIWRLQDKERPLAMTTERPACGLASLLSMSCRDRAEAFARSLQMRLQTLGLGHAPNHPAPDDPSTSSPASSVARDADDAPSGGVAAALPEDAWAASARPPLRLGSSSDSDLYYDFDLESPESPGSPAEGTVELVVARQPPRASEPESGLTSSHFDTSPDSDSSDSVGPEAFVSPSTSPGWSALPSMAPRVTLRRHPSPSSSSTAKCNGHVSTPPHETTSLGFDTNAYTDDEDTLIRLESGDFIAHETQTLNDDFTTFRSKASVQEQCFVPERNNVNNLMNATGSETRADSSSPSMCISEETKFVSCLEGESSSKARNASASVNVDISNEDEIELLPSDDSSTENLCDKGNTDTDESSFTSAEDREQFSDYICGDILEDTQRDELKEESPKNIPQLVQDKRMYESSLPQDDESFSPNKPHQNEITNDTQSAQAEMGILPRRPSWESDGNTVCGRITIIINQEDNLINATSDRDVITIRRVDDTKDNEVPILAKSPEQLGHASEKSSEVKTENSLARGLQVKAIENEEDEDSPRMRLRRCSSLKTGKTPPGTPGRKKIVRFADVLGLDLADVRTFLDEIPKIPSSAYDDLQDADLSLGSQANPVVASSFPAPPGHESDLAMTLSMVQPCKMLMPMFQQPGGQPDFLERIRIKFVCLENAVVKDPAMFSIGGVVRVRNLDFQKSVFIRYSIDNWGTHADLQATYVPNSCDGFSDKFSFVLFAHTLSVGQRLEFAIRFQTANGQYWDSNGGANYAFQCLPACSPTPYIEMPNSEDRWGTFY